MPELRTLLKSCDFSGLFLQIGWNHFDIPLSVSAGDQEFKLQGVAEKFGVQVYHCSGGDNGLIPAYDVRKKIEQELTKRAFEHLIIFTDAAKTEQVWQWVARLPGEPTAFREYRFRADQSGEAILQKLHGIRFRLDEEESLNLFAVKERLRDTFDREKVTKSFYVQFGNEHQRFQKFIEGIAGLMDKKWYASLMLNRLMFVYFIQEKGFLDGNKKYLRTKLDQVQATQGKGKFHTFYRHFLIRLFHEGLGLPESERKKRTGLDALLGRVPYLNGGLFQVHEIEERYPEIQIPDEAFEHIFAFFDEWHWHLDDRPIASGKEINPDVLGYIFEKYINAIQPGEQKAKGAYYTKEDITEYIAKNCIVPFLFDAARAKCKVAFEGDNSIWRLLRDNPDKYIYPAVRHGADNELPKNIAAGVNDISKRGEWNKSASSDFALPTETWREVVARHTRYVEVKRKLAAGEVRDINDLITLNLDIRQFAQDVIQETEGPELVRAFWRALAGHRPEKQTEQPTLPLSVLDPTCGSGAFLFAALNVLKPLYDACLQRMDAFVADYDRSSRGNEAQTPSAGDTGKKSHPGKSGTSSPTQKFSDFRAVLADMDDKSRHPNREYFILKSVVLANLYGVDIMREAVEICKLRLFLKLASQVEKDDKKENLGLEPLPDVDFNIRAGNTLVGYATAAEAKRAFTDFGGGQMKLLGEAELGSFESFNRRCADVEQTFETFRHYQLRGDGTVPPEHKLKLRDKLKALEKELNQFLARDYGVNPASKNAYDKWLDSHQPFHWFVEFYGIIQSGGFAVIIGNPPFVEYSVSKVGYELPAKSYTTLSCGNLYAFVSERCFRICRLDGSFSFIMPSASLCTPRMNPLMESFQSRFQFGWISIWDERPSKLFDGVDQQLSIHIQRIAGVQRDTFVTAMRHWVSNEREMIFKTLGYSKQSPRKRVADVLPKIASDLETKLLAKLVATPHVVSGTLMSATSSKKIYYRNAGGRYWRLVKSFPSYFRSEAGAKSTSTEKVFCVNKEEAFLFVSVFSSSLFYWFWRVVSNCRHLTNRELEIFPLAKSFLEERPKAELSRLAESFEARLQETKSRLTTDNKKSGKVVQDVYYVSSAKPIIDEIDRVLATHYGFTAEELDFIINYDIKYRLGRESEEEAE